MRPLTISRLLLQCLILGGILFCVMVLALKFGAVHVSLYGLGRDLFRVFLGKSTEISSDYSLILNLRLPRILLSVLVGASLSIAGTSFQALLRNPLADPYVLGVSNGAAVGAILASYFGPHVLVFGICVFILGLLRFAARLDLSAYRFGGVTLAIVLLIPRPGPAWPIAFHRFAEVSVGIGVALLLAWVWPEREVTPSGKPS